MYGKLFVQMYDSSIVEDPEARFTLMDMVVLSDQNGVVDMTHEALARRTNRPVEVIRSTIARLESPDNRSRNPNMDGVRLAKLDEHRDWGWIILNYDYFRKIASGEQKREKTAERVRRHRETHCNAGNAMQKEEVKEHVKEEVSSKARPSSQSEVEDFCASIGLPRSDGEAMWLDWVERGYGKTRDWKAKIQKWKIHGYHASQKQQGKEQAKQAAPTGEAYKPYFSETPKDLTDEQIQKNRKAAAIMINELTKKVTA